MAKVYGDSGIPRNPYAEWIISIRKKCKLKQADFAGRLCHYVDYGQGAVCKYYHRNSVINWEKGKNLPVNIETFVGLALMEYCGSTEAARLSLEERRLRYAHVQKRMNEFFGKRLYCRNINDALLIQAARGIYSLDEIPDIRRQMDEIIGKVVLSDEDKKEYSLEAVTDRISISFSEISNDRDFRELVARWKDYFSLGNRTVGERMRKLYEEKYSRGLNFEEAVAVYAPKYRDSYNRIFTSDFSASRQWILELCIHLRFTREDINCVLKYAGMMPLSDNTEHIEHCIHETKSAAIGSNQWFGEMAGIYPHMMMYRYKSYLQMSLKDKLAVCTLIICWLSNIGTLEDIPPVDYILEFFIQNQEGRKLIADANGVIRKKTDCEEEITRRLKKQINCLIDYINSGSERSESENARKAYTVYRQEFRTYFILPESKIQFVHMDFSVTRLYLYAALVYSVLTGRQYEGKLSRKDMDDIKKLFPPERDEMGYVYRMINHLLVVFLGRSALQKDSTGKYYVFQENRKSKAFDAAEIIEDMAESWILA